MQYGKSWLNKYTIWLFRFFFLQCSRPILRVHQQGTALCQGHSAWVYRDRWCGNHWPRECDWSHWRPTAVDGVMADIWIYTLRCGNMLLMVCYQYGTQCVTTISMVVILMTKDMFLSVWFLIKFMLKYLDFLTPDL